MNLVLYHLSGISIFFVFICINWVSVFSVDFGKDNHARSKNKAHIDPEEFLRRQKIVEAFKSNRAEEQKNWVETYSINFGMQKFENFETVSEESLDVNINPSLDEFKEKVLENTQTPNEEIENISSDFHMPKNNKEDKNTAEGTSHSKFDENTDLGRTSHLNLQTIQNENSLKPDITEDTFPEKPDDGDNTKLIIDNESNRGIDSSSPEDGIELKMIPNYESGNEDIQKANLFGNKLAAPTYSEALIKRQKIADSYLLKYAEIEKNWVEPYHFKLDPNKDFDTDLDILAQFVHNENAINLLNNIREQFSEKHFQFEDCEVKSEDGICSKSTIPENMLLQRQETLNLFLSQYGEYTKTDDWVQTYSENFKAKQKKKLLKHQSNQSSNFKDIIEKSVNLSSEAYNNSGNILNITMIDCAQVKLYLNRWVNKLLNKIETADHKSITFLISYEFVDSLKELSLSENFDIVYADEVISNFISNATLNGNYNFKWIALLPSFDNMLIYYGAVTFILSVYCWIKRKFFLSCTILFIYGVIQHAYKKHQTIIAQKHSILSSSSSSHCVNSLTSKSGIFEHFYEFFRSQWYEEECKKYYEAVMVDNLGENNVVLVITDLILSTFLQLFYSLSHALNYFVKESFYHTTFIQKGFILILLFGIVFYVIPLFFKYKIKLPFFLGTVEPGYAPIGSQVEDLRLPRSSLLQGLFYRNSDVSVLNLRNEMSKNDSKNVSIYEKIGTDTLCCNKTFIDTQCAKCNISCEACHVIKGKDLTSVKNRQKMCDDAGALENDNVYHEPKCTSHSLIKSSPKCILLHCSQVNLVSHDGIESTQDTNSSPIKCSCNSPNCNVSKIKSLALLDQEQEIQNTVNQCYENLKEYSQSGLHTDNEEIHDIENSFVKVISGHCSHMVCLDCTETSHCINFSKDTCTCKEVKN